MKFQVLPEKKKPPKNEKKPEEAQKKQTQKQEKPKKAFPKPTLSDIRDAWKALWPPLKKALRRTRQGVRIDPLDVSVILGGQAEPADAAQLYGELHGAVWTGMPVLEQLLVIPGRISTWMLILPRRRQKSWEASGFPPGSVRCCGSA